MTAATTIGKGAPTGAPDRRQKERNAAIIAMRREGATLRQIIDTLGLEISHQRVHQVWDEGATPDDRAAYEAVLGARRERSREREAARKADAEAKCIERQAEREAHVINAMHDWHALFGVPPSANDWNVAAARSLAGGWRWERYQSTGRRWPALANVIRLFGSWRAALAAAGYEPNLVGFHGTERLRAWREEQGR